MKAQVKKSMSKNTTSNNKDKKSKDKTNNKEEEEQEKEKNNIPQTQNIKNIERYIYITNFTDYNSIITINHLFEDINSLAFNLSSKIDIISKILSEEEQNSNEIDYISGFQIVDSKLRITIIEGITGRAMKIIKNSLPKKKMNDEHIKIFSDSSILFDKRIYSKYNLTLKYIRLRKNLNEILTSFDIYMNANKYRNIYDTFMNLGTILRADTLEDIYKSNSFPDADKLIELEEKYSESLTHEDLTGEKKLKKYNIKDLLINLENTNTSYYKINNNPLTENKNGKSNIAKSMKLIPIKTKGRIILNKESLNQEENNDNNYFNIVKKNNETNSNNNRYLTLNNENNKRKLYLAKIINRKDRNNSKNIHTINYVSSNKNINKLSKIFGNNSIAKNSNKHKIFLRKTPKVDAKNKIFIKILKERENKIVSPIEIFNRNKKYLNKILRKKPSDRFCLPFKGEYNKKKEILFGPSKLNHYEELVNEMRKKYINDKNNYYSYSEKALTLSFPMVEGFRNEEYLNYIENKSKWISEKDFDRYKQPEREKIFFPRIIKEL